VTGLPKHPSRITHSLPAPLNSRETVPLSRLFATTSAITVTLKPSAWVKYPLFVIRLPLSRKISRRVNRVLLLMATPRKLRCRVMLIRNSLPSCLSVLHRRQLVLLNLRVRRCRLQLRLVPPRRLSRFKARLLRPPQSRLAQRQAQAPLRAWPQVLCP
jgi:hypothetical protein